MIFKSTIMAVTLASAVLAAPSQAENGIKVPLTKRDSSFADVNGKFDTGKAQVRDSNRSAVFVPVAVLIASLLGVAGSGR